MLNQVKNWTLENVNIDASMKEYLIDVQALLCTRLKWLDIQDTYFCDNSFEQLQKDNRELYEPLMKNYERSYANPDYAMKHLPNQVASTCCQYYYEVYNMVPLVFQKRMDVVKSLIQKFFLLSDILQDKATLNDYVKENLQSCSIQMKDEILQMYGANNFYSTMHQQTDFQDLRYLFRYGIYISESELAYANIMKDYSDEDIHKLASQMVEGFLKGFIVRNKKESNRNTARVVQIVGLEKISHEILNILKDKDYKGMVGEIVFKGISSQIIYDHRQDDTIWFNDEYASEKLKGYEEALVYYTEDVQQYLGNIIMVSFGQTKLDTTKKEFALGYSDDQNQIMKTMNMEMKQILEKFIPKAEVSFTGMAFPVNEIHQDYATIFEHIMMMNTMDSNHHEQMQELIIQALDQGEYVEIKGYRGNETHMKVYLQPLTDPSSQTNFVNCGADINIPVGEVYTSPYLKGSTGILHVRKARISKIAFQDIRIKFIDGYVSEYSCQNSDNEKENHDLMEEVIFHYRDTLPIGEFALGTNTYAYALAKKDDILYKLHTLIFEKLGPHIAIGDTCFAWSEDNCMKSLYSGKEMIAKDNEVSILRKEDVTKAYTGVHYDLTIPYEDIGCIKVITHDKKEIEIVKEGRIVLAGCEALNLPLDDM